MNYYESMENGLISNVNFRRVPNTRIPDDKSVSKIRVVSFTKPQPYIPTSKKIIKTTPNRICVRVKM